MSKTLDFKGIAATALRQAETIAAHFAPQGKLNGREWVALCPSRSDSSPRSFSLNVDTGVWADFSRNATGADIISYVAYCRNIGQKEALIELANFLGVDAGSKQVEPSNQHQSVPVAPKKPDFLPMLPVPVNALNNIPKSHPQLGKPTMHWDYLNSAGELMMRVYRFERINSEGARVKEFRPLVFGEGIVKKSGELRTGWHWRQLPGNRPLYGLELLGNFPSNIPVILVEGEKACNACRLLFPSNPCMTWSGGAKAVSKTNWSALNGRTVWLWRDNDEAGLDTIKALEKPLKSAGVASFVPMDISLFAQYKPEKDGVLLEQPTEWPNKADAYDAVQAGWTSQHIEQILNKLLATATSTLIEQVKDSGTPIDTKPSKSETKADKDKSAPYGFKVDDKGVHWLNRDGDQDRWIRICARLDVVAFCRDAGEIGDNWGMLLEFKNRDGKTKRLNIPMELFGTDGGAEINKRLLRLGLEYDARRDSKRKVLEYLQATNTKERVGLVNKTGWHNGAFVFPDKTLGNAQESIMFYNDGATLCKLSEKGTLESWQKNVSAYCMGNPLALFAMSAAFSAPLVELMGFETMGFHMYGGSSWGKSTLLDLACSIFGNPKDYKKAWRSTDNGMEALAASHSEMLLALDEINQFDPRKLGDTIYMLGNGSGKTRASDRGGARDDLHKWRFTFLSNGEKTLEQYMGEADKKATAGMEMRFLEIRATTHESEADIKRMGVFSNTHELMGGAALSELLKGSMALHHGTAFPAFIRALVNEIEGEKRGLFIEKMQKHINAFREKYVSPTASGQVQRAAVKFALVAWAGEYATLWGVTGWQQSSAARAAVLCFKSWLNARGGDGNFEEKQILDHVRHTLQKYQESRFKRWDEPQRGKENDTVIDSHVPITAEFWGFRREIIDKNALEGDSSDIDFYIFPDAFRKDVCKGLDAVHAARILRDIGALILTESDKKAGNLKTNAKLPRMGSKNQRVYRIRNSLLFDGGADSVEDIQDAA